MFGEAVRSSSLFGLLGMLVSVGVLGLAVRYAISPSERRLALMRPLSLAAIFGGLSTLMGGVINIFRGIAETGAGSGRAVSAGAAESVVGLFVAFGCLTVAWLLIAVGVWRADSSR